MKKKVENDDKPRFTEKPKNTLGFGVNDAPLWLCKALFKEAEQYYGNIYWPVIVDWYRKAKEFENMVRGGVPPPSVQPVEQDESNDDDPSISLFGGHKGEKK